MRPWCEASVATFVKKRKVASPRSEWASRRSGVSLVVCVRPSDERVRDLQRTEERFVIRIRGRGAGIAPSVGNYQDVDNGFALALLPVDGESPDEFGSIRDLLFASGADH